MPTVLLHACLKSFPQYIRSLFAGALYLCLMSVLLTLCQFLIKGIWPKTVSVGLTLIGNSLLFHLPLVMGLSLIWAVAWVSMKWKTRRTPMFFELNAIPKTHLLWVVQPMICPILLMIALSMHWISPNAGQRLHAIALQNLGDQVSVGTIERWGNLYIGAQGTDGTSYQHVFVANDQMAALSQTARIGNSGSLELMTGELFPLEPNAQWSMTFSKTTVNRLSHGLRWTVHMIDSGRLNELIAERSSSFDLQRALIKRTTQVIGLWFLSLAVLILGINGFPLGLNIGFAIGWWWLPMRFFDHQIMTLGPMGSAVGPLIVQTMVFICAYAYWRRY
ncbi:MAG: hypothetical protein VXZ96_20525 [Myxococcota bacterium]|nr:hypothetical protein [Myxococcota bacterium]